MPNQAVYTLGAIGLKSHEIDLPKTIGLKINSLATINLT
jgi:hypothetical protein